MATVVDQDLDRFARSRRRTCATSPGELPRASAEVEALRELVDHLVDANLVLRDYRQNLIMKKVTSWAAIIAVPTLVTGYYGMNVPYPGSGETWGVVAVDGGRRRLLGRLYLAVPPQAVALTGPGQSPPVIRHRGVGVVGPPSRRRIRRSYSLRRSGDGARGKPSLTKSVIRSVEVGSARRRPGRAPSATAASRRSCGGGDHGVDDDLRVDAVGLGDLGDRLAVAQRVAQLVVLDADGRRAARRAPTPPKRRRAEGPGPRGPRRRRARFRPGGVERLGRRRRPAAWVIVPSATRPPSASATQVTVVVLGDGASGPASRTPAPRAAAPPTQSRFLRFIVVSFRR